MKENIEPGTAIIHIDYSERYHNKQQDEITVHILDRRLSAYLRHVSTTRLTMEQIP